MNSEKERFGEGPEADLAIAARKLYPKLKPSGKGRVGHSIKKRLMKLQQTRWHWLDHYEVDGDTFISEPYAISEEDVKQLIEACDSLDLTFSISAQSWHYPHHTLRITIKKKRPKIESDLREILYEVEPN
jgi:hypothetical protein